MALGAARTAGPNSIPAGIQFARVQGTWKERNSNSFHGAAFPPLSLCHRIPRLPRFASHKPCNVLYFPATLAKSSGTSVRRNSFARSNFPWVTIVPPRTKTNPSSPSIAGERLASNYRKSAAVRRNEIAHRRSLKFHPR